MTQTVNQENMPATFHFGLKTLFDGYLTTPKFLCDGYVIGGPLVTTQLIDNQCFFM